MVWLIVLHKIAMAVEGGVSVAKAQHPWMVVVGPKIRSDCSTIFLEISASAVITRVVKSEFKGVVCNSLIVWVVIVPNKTFRALQKKKKKKKKRQ